jgi:hypothetical protein
MPRDPVQLALPREIPAIAAVPRDRANERNDAPKKIVVGELKHLQRRHISHIVKYAGCET